MNYFLVLVQSGEGTLGYFAGDPILLGLYSGELLGTGYMYLAALLNIGFMD